MGSTKRLVGVLLPLLPLAAGPARVVPTGFIDASKMWNIDKVLDDGSELEDQGSCAKRVEFRADGTVRSVHSYERTITRQSVYTYPNGRTIQTRILTVSMSGQAFPFPDEFDRLRPNLRPTEYEYQAVARVMQHRDGTVTLTYRPVYAQIYTVQREQTWRLEGTRQVDYRDGKWKLVTEVCDPIEEFQKALAFNARMRGERRLGRLPALAGDDSAAVDMPVRGYPFGTARLKAHWSLTP